MVWSCSVWRTILSWPDFQPFNKCKVMVCVVDGAQTNSDADKASGGIREFQTDSKPKFVPTFPKGSKFVNSDLLAKFV